MIPIENAFKINCEQITVPTNRHRTMKPEHLKMIAKSMKDVGLINPITVRPDPEGDDYFILIAGATRLAAAKALEWDCIPCIVANGLDAIDAEIFELRENLDRGELTALERTQHVAALKKALAGKAELKRGNPHGKANSPHDAGNSDKRGATVKAVAEESGLSTAIVERDLSLAERLEKVEDINDAAGTCLDSPSELKALASLPPAMQHDLIARAKAGEKVSAKAEAKKLAREEKERALADKQEAMPAKKYGVIYADPPWKFKVRTEGGKDRSAENHYPVQDIDAILDMDVASIAAPDCALFLWATVPMLPEALRVMRAWGFEYKSSCVWIKDKRATGFWFRNQHEILMLGTRGNVPAPAPGKQWASAINSPVEKHSAKPAAFYDLIEDYFPNLPKIEMYARTAREGWESWGKEAPQMEKAK